jgi:hypothetical protein
VSRFLDALFPDLTGSYVEVRAFGERTRRYFARSIKSANAAIADARDHHDVYVGIATRSRRGGTKADLGLSYVVWADVDRPNAEALLRVAGLPEPSMIVASGSPGRLHAYWRLTEPSTLREPEAIALFESYLRGVASAVGGDPACVDASRLMRAPGTRNHKHDPPVLCEIVSYTPARYRLDAFPRGAVVEADRAELGEAKAPAREVRTAWVRDVLDNGYEGQRNRDKSAVDFKVAARLLAEGFAPEEVLYIVEHSPAIGERKANADYWPRTIRAAAARRKVLT